MTWHPSDIYGKTGLFKFSFSQVIYIGGLGYLNFLSHMFSHFSISLHIMFLGRFGLMACDIFILGITMNQDYFSHIGCCRRRFGK